MGYIHVNLSAPLSNTKFASTHHSKKTVSLTEEGATHTTTTAVSKIAD